MSCFLWQILVCTYRIYMYGQSLVAGVIPSGSVSLLINTCFCFFCADLLHSSNLLKATPLPLKDIRHLELKVITLHLEIIFLTWEELTYLLPCLPLEFPHLQKLVDNTHTTVFWFLIQDADEWSLFPDVMGWFSAPDASDSRCKRVPRVVWWLES